MAVPFSQYQHTPDPVHRTGQKFPVRWTGRPWSVMRGLQTMETYPGRKDEIMTTSRRWSVDIFIDEHEGERSTRAEARLHTNDKTHLVGHGDAHRNPADTEIAEIGDELAVARALSDLAHKLLHAAASDIEAITHKPAHVHR